MDSLRVTLIGIHGTGPGDPTGRTEACEVRLGQGSDITSDALQRILAAIKPSDYVYDDVRHHTNWGATGLEMQEIVILYAIQVAGQITASGVLDVLGKRLGELIGPRIDDGNAAWNVFQEFLVRAFKLPDARLISAIKKENTWTLVAEARGRRYEGKISDDGRVIEARRVEQ